MRKTRLNTCLWDFRDYFNETLKAIQNIHLLKQMDKQTDS